MNKKVIDEGKGRMLEWAVIVISSYPPCRWQCPIYNGTLETLI